MSTPLTISGVNGLSTAAARVFTAAWGSHSSGASGSAVRCCALVADVPESSVIAANRTTDGPRHVLRADGTQRMIARPDTTGTGRSQRPGARVLNTQGRGCARRSFEVEDPHSSSTAEPGAGRQGIPPAGVGPKGQRRAGRFAAGKCLHWCATSGASVDCAAAGPIAYAARRWAT